MLHAIELKRQSFINLITVYFPVLRSIIQAMKSGREEKEREGGRGGREGEKEFYIFTACYENTPWQFKQNENQKDQAPLWLRVASSQCCKLSVFQIKKIVLL